MSNSKLARWGQGLVGLAALVAMLEVLPRVGLVSPRYLPPFSARVAAGGEYDELFYRPTVLADVPPTSPAFVEEIFGPVAPVTRVGSVEEATAFAAQGGWRAGQHRGVHRDTLDHHARRAGDVSVLRRAINA